MGLTLVRAFRLPPTTPNAVVAFVGAGGKTRAMFQTARELKPPVIVTATTHLGAWQLSLADRHIITDHQVALHDVHFDKDVMLFTGPVRGNNRTEPIDKNVLSWLYEAGKREGIPILVEADGSHQRALKAPQEDEPPIPEFADVVVLVAGLSALGKPLTDAFVHRPEFFSKLSGLRMGERIFGEAVAGVLTNPNGGCKNIPPRARRVVLLNQADTLELKSQARGMVDSLLRSFDSVVVASLHEQAIHAAHERVAGIILAAGESTRYGQPKQLLTWHGNPFVRSVAMIALDARLSQVVVVTGAHAEQIEASVRGLPVKIVRNEHWQSGQASSIGAGVRSLQSETGSAIFLLADQPQVTPAVVRKLVETHASELHPIVAPLVQGERRANPVLFDQLTFPDLLALKGDIGGRAIFSKFRVEYVPWHDERLLLDVDKPEDYERLLRDDIL